MSTENVAPSAQDENSVLKRSKISSAVENSLAAQHSQHNSRASLTTNTKISTRQRPALSNLTNTSSQALPSDTQNLQSFQNQIISDVIIEEQPKRLPLKRPATESSTNLVEKTNGPDTKKAKKEYDWEDLDADDVDDPLMVCEYVGEIFEYLSELEVSTAPDPSYLTWQPNFKPKMRSILVDWIVEVHLRFRLLPETLFLAINMVDRFMSKETVQIEKLQLLATGALFVAAKYEEVYSPSVKNYSYVTDGGYTEEEILTAERYILQVLQFDLSYPNPMNFLRRISKADDYDIETRTVGKYLLEISIMDHAFIGLKPSLCAAAAMFVSRKMLQRSDWNGTLIHYSGGYTKNDMKHVVEMILNYLTQPVAHEEFFKKYASKKYMKASILARRWAKKVEAENIDILAD
jgi:G2/mitotic-specific cyclin 1/2